MFIVRHCHFGYAAASGGALLVTGTESAVAIRLVRLLGEVLQGRIHFISITSSHQQQQHSHSKRLL